MTNTQNLEVVNNVAEAEVEAAVTIMEAEMPGTYNRKTGKINLTEQVAEARVQRFVEEEEELTAKDPAIKELKDMTDKLIMNMLLCKSQGNEEARREVRNEIVTLNMRLVTQVIKKYGYFSPDKFQNGCVGLLKATDTFDPSKGVPFGNYAAFCIEMEIRVAYKRQNRAFESKVQGYLDSLDAPSTLANGDTVDRHETESDYMATLPFEEVIAEAEIDTLFWQIIIPTIREYGTRGKGIDMEKWCELEIEYFIGLSLEKSQRQRLTFTAMAKELGSTPNNIRARHLKVLSLIKEACEKHGYTSAGRNGDFK